VAHIIDAYLHSVGAIQAARKAFQTDTVGSEGAGGLAATKGVQFVSVAHVTSLTFELPLSLQEILRTPAH
jgi:hypothetical protein